MTTQHNNKSIKKIVENFDIEANTIDCDVLYRGGTLEVNVSELFLVLCERLQEKLIMGAYQNYLGGGIAGAIVGGASFEPSELSAREQKIFYALKERIKKYFYSLNAGGGDDYMVENVNSYQKNQLLPVNGY